MWTREFWQGAAERAVKSFAQTLLLLWASDSQLDVLQINWPVALSLAGGAALLSVLTSVASSPFGVRGSPSLVDDTPGRHST